MKTSNHPLRAMCAIGLLTILFCYGPVASACGPFSLTSVFTFTVHPEYPLENYARGEIGVVQPSYARSYLAVAYRYLNGAAFNQTEQAALVELWKDRLESRWDAGDQEWIKEWLTARAKVAGVGEAPKIDVFRSREKPNEYETYLNCQGGAFENAAATLEARIKQLGPDNPAVKQWVEAQDQVFANCSEGQHLPAALPVDADARLHADRQYQIAAANFYAGNFDQASSLFKSISLDTKSPWHLTAPYLEARTLLRKASLGAPETKKQALTESESQLNKILKDPELKASHEDAGRLLKLVRLRLRPEETLHELGTSLATKNAHENLKQDLWDYTLLLDDFVMDDDDSEAAKSKPISPSLRGDDMTDWIVSFQIDNAENLDHSLQRWEATGSTPWLIASLAGIDSKHAKTSSLLRAAANIPPTSPAFATASYHSIRIDIAAGRFAEARTKLDDLLAKHRSRFNQSALNLFLHQRLLVSENLSDFVTYAQRLPAGLSWDEDGREIPADPDEAEENKKTLSETHFDEDAGRILNEGMPLALLKEIVSNHTLPVARRIDVAQAVWLRAVLLGDNTTANAVAPELKTLVPEMAPALDSFLSNRQPDAKKFTAIYTWLKFPGLEPVIDIGVGRGTPLGEQDSYRDNWWCRAAFQEKKAAVTADEPSAPIFLSPQQKAVAQRESAALAALGAAPNYLARQVVDFATRNPTDPRVPEALHLVVQSTRYGCTDKQTGRWSKTAYDLLHHRYPNNAWTKKTPYWFKE